MSLQITITGTPGSGKSTIGRMLAERLQIPFYSMGDMRRQYATAHGMTINELNALREKDTTSDRLVDEYQQQLSEKEQRFVLDSRLGYHFLPKSIKIFVKADFAVAAERITRQHRKEEPWKTAAEGARLLRARMENDYATYTRLYGVPAPTGKEFDFVLDTTHRMPEQAVEECIAFLEKRKTVKN